MHVSLIYIYIYNIVISPLSLVNIVCCVIYRYISHHIGANFSDNGALFPLPPSDYLRCYITSTSITSSLSRVLPHPPNPHHQGEGYRE